MQLQLQLQSTRVRRRAACFVRCRHQRVLLCSVLPVHTEQPRSRNCTFGHQLTNRFVLCCVQHRYMETRSLPRLAVLENDARLDSVDRASFDPAKYAANRLTAQQRQQFAIDDWRLANGDWRLALGLGVVARP